MPADFASPCSVWLLTTIHSKQTSRWERSVVWAILRNPAYRGGSAFGKIRVAGRIRVTRALRRHSAIVSGNSVGHERAREQWIEIPVRAGERGGPLSNASASGAGRSSCNQNQGAAGATQVPPSTQPANRRQAVRSFRSARREAPDPGVRMATAAAGDPGDGDQADGAPARRPPTRRSPAQLGGKARYRVLAVPPGPNAWTGQ
jgi:hypothetical protein